MSPYAGKTLSDKLLFWKSASLLRLLLKFPWSENVKPLCKRDVNLYISVYEMSSYAS